MDIHRIVVEDWQSFRELRLAALTDTPEAFGETLAHAQACDEQNWRERLARMQGEDALGVVGIAMDGTWAGTMRTELTDGDAWLYGVYVAPQFRRAGVAQNLLDTVVAWASGRASRLLLHVATTNIPARGFYDRNGFVATGRSEVNPAHPGVTEMEMARTL